MKYICLVYQDEQEMAGLSDEELASIVRGCGDWVEDLERGGHHIFSEGLQSIRTATRLRKEGGRVTLTDGPFSETKEVLGGFTILEARDLNEAIQLASRLPMSERTCLEVRPVMDVTLPLTDPVDMKLARAIRVAAGEAFSG